MNDKTAYLFQVACTVIAGVLQLLFLVVFFMMLLKGIEILLCVVRLFTIKFPLVPLLIFAWCKITIQYTFLLSIMYSAFFFH